MQHWGVLREGQKGGYPVGRNSADLDPFNRHFAWGEGLEATLPRTGFISSISLLCRLVESIIAIYI